MSLKVRGMANTTVNGKVTIFAISINTTIVNSGVLNNGLINIASKHIKMSMVFNF